MSEIEKINQSIASICRGEDKKSDAMMLMSPESNWDQFLTPAPFAIALLGELILISADTDFSLQDKPPTGGFKYLRYPNSFRASLVQVSNAGWSAFNEAHTCMDQISLHSGNVDGHVKNAVKFLIRGQPNEIEQMLPLALSKIQQIADESLNLATKIEGRFEDVMKLTAELLEACTSTKGVYDEKNRETEIALKVSSMQTVRREKEVKEAEQRFKNMESKVKDAQSEFKCSIDNIPTGGSMLKLAAGEALIDGIRGIFSFGGLFRNVATKIKTVFQPEYSIEQDEAYYDKELSLQRVYAQVPAIVKDVNQIFAVVTGEKDEHGLSALDLKAITDGTLRYLKHSLEACRDNVNSEVLSGMPGIRASTICKKGISICCEVQQAVKDINFQNQPPFVSKFVARVKKLQGETIALDAEASRAQGKNPLDNKSPHLSKIPTESSSPSVVKSAAENARYKTELAKETLKDAKLRQEKSADELRLSSEKLTQVLTEMAKLNLQKIDFNQIRDTLVKGIKALADVREQWGKLVRFFQMLSNMIKCCLHTSLKDFVDTAKSGREIQMKDYKIPISDIFRDVIFEEASKASQMAYVVRTISCTYVQISNEHLMDKITSLGSLIALDPKLDGHVIQRRRAELNNGCAAAQRSIQSIVLKKKAEFNQNIDERMRKISEIEAKLPAIDRTREEEIKKSVCAGIENFSQEEMNNLI